ncbi:hypothetical protein C8F01DRAFT_1092137 [Mycena amicta]|nr:hypothetical protein C8F01DRAFT_1092137 [Mycena amicta]
MPCRHKPPSVFTLPCSSDSPGFLYVFTENYGTVSKIGRTNCPPRRKKDWAKQCDPVQQNWACCWKVPCARKFEMLVHSHFKCEGAWLRPTPCLACFVKHCEKFDTVACGGLNEIVHVVEDYLQQLGWHITRPKGGGERPQRDDRAKKHRQTVKKVVTRGTRTPKLPSLLAPPSSSDASGFLYVFTEDFGATAKIGHTNCPPRRKKEWAKQCDPVPQKWVYHWRVRYARKFESLIHAHFKHKGAWIRPYPCQACLIKHREKFDAHKCGGQAEIVRVVEDYLTQLGWAVSRYVLLSLSAYRDSARWGGQWALTNAFDVLRGAYSSTNKLRDWKSYYYTVRVARTYKGSANVTAAALRRSLLHVIATVRGTHIGTLRSSSDDNHASGGCRDSGGGR